LLGILVQKFENKDDWSNPGQRGGEEFQRGAEEFQRGGRRIQRQKNFQLER
jgi:hypothetical protein